MFAQATAFGLTARALPTLLSLGDTYLYHFLFFFLSAISFFGGGGGGIRSFLTATTEQRARINRHLDREQSFISVTALSQEGACLIIATQTAVVNQYRESTFENRG